MLEIKFKQFLRHYFNNNVNYFLQTGSLSNL